MQSKTVRRLKITGSDKSVSLPVLNSLELYYFEALIAA